MKNKLNSLFYHFYHYNLLIFGILFWQHWWSSRTIGVGVVRVVTSCHESLLRRSVPFFVARRRVVTPAFLTHIYMLWKAALVQHWSLRRIVFDPAESEVTDLSPVTWCMFVRCKLLHLCEADDRPVSLLFILLLNCELSNIPY